MNRVSIASVFCSMLKRSTMLKPVSSQVASLSRAHLLQPCPYSTDATKSGQPDPIPRFPVQPLQQTVERYLQTAKPLLDLESFKRATQLSQDLLRPGGEGEKLQVLLEQRAKNSINWLEEWWLNIAYLEYRLPVPIHVNPGITTPRLAFRGLDQQLRHASNVITRVLEFKKQIDEKTLPVDTLGGAPLCMKQFYRILGCCRVPRPIRDDVFNRPINVFNRPINVFNRPIKITQTHYSDSQKSYLDIIKGKPLTNGELYAQLKRIVDQSQDFAPAVGILTTEQRDTWSKVYERIVQDIDNQMSLSDIHTSICVLCLDESSVNVGQGSPSTSTSDLDTVFVGQVNHGGGSKLNTGNRWFDKIFQVFISPDGLLGFNYEHSAAEGPPIVQLADHCYDKLTGDVTEAVIGNLATPRRLRFNLTDDLHSAITTASNNIDKSIDNLTLIHYKFTGFGKDEIKKLKSSPDAFIQVTFQLAYYRLHGRCVATYESGSLRKFHHGRTDTIRSCTVESKAYCRAMDRKDVPVPNKISLLRSALTAHRQYTDHVINGRGIDRHMLGLKLLALENNIKVPQLLNDPVYTETCNWRISTSQVASRCGGLLGFGPVVDDGYGICYNPMDSSIQFAVSSWNDCKETDAKRLAACIGNALEDARQLLQQIPPQAKL